MLIRFSKSYQYVVNRKETTLYNKMKNTVTCKISPAIRIFLRSTKATVTNTETALPSE